MRNVIALVTCAALTLALTATAAEPPKKEPAAKPAKPAEYVVGEMHAQDLPAMNFVYGSAQTTFEKLMEPIGQFMPLLTKALDEGKIRSQGSAMFVYKGVTEDMSKPFTLEVGYLVSDKTQAPEGLKLRKIPATKCATILFTGPVTQLRAAYEKLIPAITAGGLTVVPGETREAYLYFEAPDSANNVTQIQIPIK